MSRIKTEIGRIVIPGRRGYFETSEHLTLWKISETRCLAFFCPDNPKRWGSLLELDYLGETDLGAMVVLQGIEVEVEFANPGLAKWLFAKLGDPWETVEWAPKEDAAMLRSRDEAIEKRLAELDNVRGPFARRGFSE